MIRYVRVLRMTSLVFIVTGLFFTVFVSLPAAKLPIQIGQVKAKLPRELEPNKTSKPEQLEGVSDCNHKRNDDAKTIECLRRTIARLRDLNPMSPALVDSLMYGPLRTIYIITPTYARPQQKAELTRLSYVFRLVPSVHWIVVEDSDEKTPLVGNVLRHSRLPHTHLNVVTGSDHKPKKNKVRTSKHRGVSQRNAGITWVRNSLPAEADGVVYFADDDNTYSTRLFEEMRNTKTISVWPVGFLARAMYGGPVCTNKKVIGWHTAWKQTRHFPLDMAAFAVSLDLLRKKEKALFSHRAKLGYMESHFLSQLANSTDILEPRADNCTKVYVWHTRTAEVDLEQEEAIQNTSIKGIEI